MTSRNAYAHLLGQPRGYFYQSSNSNNSQDVNIKTYVGNWIVPGVQKQEIV